MPTAVLIDGGFFVKRFRSIEPHNSHNAQRCAELAFAWAVEHLKQPKRNRDLYRIFFYDCPPLEKGMHNPISKKHINFAKSAEAVFRKELHGHLRAKRKMALRLGQLSSMTQWALKPETLADLIKGRRKFEDIEADELYPSVKQKGVDMRIGIDISSLALKKQVDQIILMAGDADFVPAAKLARREGIDFVLDPMWNLIPADLREHIDGLRTVCPRPARHAASPAAEAADAAEAAADATAEAEAAPAPEAP